LLAYKGILGNVITMPVPIRSISIATVPKTSIAKGMSTLNGIPKTEKPLPIKALSTVD
jgi:hypothetical protein